MFNRWHIWRIHRPRKKLCCCMYRIVCNSFCCQEVLNVSATQRTYFGLQYFTDVAVAFQITQYPQLVRSSIIRNRTPDHNFDCSSTMIFHNTLRSIRPKVALAGIASNTNAAILLTQIKAVFIKQTIFCQYAHASPCSWVNWSSRHRSFCKSGILYKGVIALSPRCSRRRRIHEADSDTPVWFD